MLALIDDRADRGLHSDPLFYAQFHQMLEGPEGWFDFFRRLQATHLLLPVNSPLAAKAPEHGLTPVFSDRLAVVFKLPST